MIARILIAAALATPALLAQVDDPQAKIRQILTKVQEEMNEIDKLLLQSSQRGSSASEAITRSTKKIDELVKETKKSQDGVIRQMDDLLEELQKMAKQSQSQSQQDSGEQPDKSQRPQPGEQRDEQQRGQQNEQNQTPDMVRQQQQQRGQQPKPQQKQPDGRDPKGVQKDQVPGENRRGEKPPEAGEEIAPHVIDNQRWGNLPKYLEFMHSRGGLPEVPELYRPFYEAYLKQDQKPKAPADSPKK